MKAIWLVAAVFSGSLATSDAMAAAAPDDRCAALAMTALNQATIETTGLREAGAFPLPAPAARSLVLPGFCRVHGRAMPSSDSDIHFEVWLPTDVPWNGKLLAVGNGGYSGAIAYWQMAQALRRGYAVAGGDTGHTGEGLEFGLGHPEKIKDWGDRSIHAIASAAKAIVRAYEGKDAGRSYFEGCSTGGHQGLTEAQRYPSDFDGIIAGAPGNNRTHLNVAFLWEGVQNLSDPAGRLSADDLAMITRAVVKECDAKDGLADGIIADPRRCRLTPHSLLCDGVKTDKCLTAAQVHTLEMLYQGPRNPRTQVQIYPPFTEGSEAGWNVIIGGSEPYRKNFWSEWVFEDSAWSWKTFDWDLDVARADQKFALVINANDSDLSAFEAHGGKVLMYQGWIDPITSALDTIRYYDAVTEAMGGARKTREFARLFLVPGMGHCGTFGTGSFATMPEDDGLGRDPLSLLERWVEKSDPPKRLVVEETMGPKMGRTRLACAVPERSAWNRKGSIDRAESFVCKR
jgi:feruloyl esterase